MLCRHYISDLLSFGLKVIITGEVFDGYKLCLIQKGNKKLHGVLCISEDIPYGVELYNLSEVISLLDMLEVSKNRKYAAFKLLCRKLVKHIGFYLLEGILLFGLFAGQIFIYIKLFVDTHYYGKEHSAILIFSLIMFSVLMLKGIATVIFCMRIYGIDTDYWKAYLESFFD